MKKSLITILILLLIMATMPMTVFADSKDDSGDEETGYLTFSSESEFGLALVRSNQYAPSVNVEYSTDGNTWTTWDGTSVAAVQTNGVYAIYVRGSDNTQFATATSQYNYFSITGSGRVACSGNIETLLNYTAVLAKEHPEMDDYCFYGLFENCTALTKAPKLEATDLTMGCYECMFYGCTSLTTAPDLPATTLADNCYKYMF